LTITSSAQEWMPGVPDMLTRLTARLRWMGVNLGLDADGAIASELWRVWKREPGDLVSSGHALHIALPPARQPTLNAIWGYKRVTARASCAGWSEAENLVLAMTSLDGKKKISPPAANSERFSFIFKIACRMHEFLSR
jgi:hypothetical protein